MSAIVPITNTFNAKNKNICWYPMNNDAADRIAGNTGTGSIVYSFKHWSGAPDIKIMGPGNSAYQLTFPTAVINLMKGKKLILDFQMWTSNNSPSVGGETNFICNTLSHQWFQFYFSQIRVQAPNYGILLTGALISTNRWYRVTMIWNNPGFKMYYDKSLVCNQPTGDFSFRSDLSSCGWMRYSDTGPFPNGSYYGNIMIINSTNLGDVP